MSQNRLFLVFCLLISAIVAGLCIYPLAESDVFWQIRAGREIWSSFHVQTVDTWSSTANGTPWFNFEWLFCCFVYACKSVLGSYAFLPLIRGALAFTVFMALGHLAKSVTRADASARVVFLALVGVVFLVCWSPFDLRADIFGNLCFLGLILLFCSSRDISPRNRFLMGLAILVFWANVHAGTVPIGIFLVASAVAFGVFPERLPVPSRVGMIVAVFLTWFLTPIGWHAVEMVILYAKYDATIAKNGDQIPLLWEHFTFQIATISNYVLFLFLISTLVGYFFNSRALSARLPAMFRNRAFVSAVALVLFFLMTQKYRNARYLVFFLSPIALVLWSDAIERLNSARLRVAVTATVALVSLSMIGFRYARRGGDWGLGLDGTHLPIASVDFIKKHRPAGRISNSYNFGGYMIAELPEYPTSLDSRELIFESFMQKSRSALTNPSILETFLDSNNFDIILSEVDREKAFRLRAMLNPAVWSLVHVDDNSLLFLRRNQANQELIAQFDYPALFVPKADEQRVSKDLSRCRPDSELCRAVYQ